MQSIQQASSGVLHQQQSQQHYQLRRYKPHSQYAELVEQYWFVDWKLPAKTIHTQQNLPDPNLHLVLEKNQLTLIGPVSKKYSYKMSGTGGIVGVKFALAALAPHLPHTMSYYVDKTLPASHLFTEDIAHHLVSLLQSSDDQQAVSCLEAYLKNLAVEHSDAQKQAATLVNLIKHSPHIYSVAQLADESGLSQRSIQRLCHRYIGLSPKWLIRKYRLHQALKQLDKGDVTMIDLALRLGYSDQPHLIRDFKEIVGMTPKHYVEQKTP